MWLPGKDELVRSAAVNYFCPVDMLMDKPFQANSLPASQRMGIATTAYVLELHSFCLIYKTHLKSDSNVSQSLDHFKMLILRTIFGCNKNWKHARDITGSHN